MVCNTPVVILCDLPNLQRLSFIEGGKDFEGNRRLVDCLDILGTYMEDTLGLRQNNKWLFGDAWMYDHQKLLLALHKRGWKYVACPSEEVFTEGNCKPIFVSTSDSILKSTWRTFMRNVAESTHYVFISDDTDFIPDIKSCILHNHDVTLFVSGQHNHTQARQLKKKGATVLEIKDLLVKEKPLVDVVPHTVDIVKGEPLETEKRPDQSSLAWSTKKTSESPLEKFQRRYKNYKTVCHPS